MKRKDKREKMLKAGAALVKKRGLDGITRDDVAEKAGVSKGLVNYYFGDFDDFKSRLMAYAIEEEDERLLVHGLAAGDRIARKAPLALKDAALNSLR